MRSSIVKIHLLQVDRGQGGEQRERSSWGERWPDCHGHGGSGAFQAKKEDIICVQEMWSQERCQPWHRDAVTWAQVTLNGTVLKWQEERKITSANVEDWSFEHHHLADVPRACFGHWPTTSCSCSAFQDGLGLLAHFTRDFLRWPAEIDSTFFTTHWDVTEVQWFALQVGYLPLSHPKEGGQLYLVNMGIPKNVYKEVNSFYWNSYWFHVHDFRLASSLPLPSAPSLSLPCTSRTSLVVRSCLKPVHHTTFSTSTSMSFLQRPW